LISISQRDALRAHLDANGVKTILQWGGKMLHQFRDLKLNDDVPATEALRSRFMLLPMNTSLSDEDVAYVCEQVLRFHR
jgi:dTDP-4-amino-4,6-dideoxygalactose transaminase